MRMARKGLYNDWIQGKGLENVCMWARLGLTDKQICHNMGVSQQTYYEWQRRFPSFSEAIKSAKTIPDLELENAMFQLAIGKMTVEETKSILDPRLGKVIRIERVKKQIPPNPTMQIFLAKNRMPDKYRNVNRYDTGNTEVEDTEVEIYLPKKEGLNDE